ncbi:MAG: PTS transporter subunit EIIC [Erysipelotrichaceae bacterium]|nr:PTS transporter subunit EIIC [Erysipelotrichaceae bacterium]MBR6957621.1 PTS transporter subunit EIIC [Erysipelotrichaceae bacterium]
MAKDYKALADKVIENVGGVENVESLAHCVTRLRFKLRDAGKVNKETLAKVPGVLKVMEAAGQLQVVIGQDVTDAYDAILNNYTIKAGGEVDADAADTKADKGEKKGNIAGGLADMVSGIFMPFMGAFMGAGLLKGLLVLLTTWSILDKASSTYTILYAIADGTFYFLPFFLAYCAGKKFGGNPFITMALAAAMLYPNFTALSSSENPVTFLGIPVVMMSYSSTVLPIIVAAWLEALLEKFLNRVLPKVIRSIFTPLIVMVVVFPLVVLVVGPVTDIVGKGLANIIKTGLDTVPLLGGFLMAALWPIMIIFGVHWGIVPIVMNNHAVLGYDYILPLTVGTNFGIAAAVFAISLKSKKAETKEMAFTAAASAFVGGVTEPAIYGILMKCKTIFGAVCLANGIGGAICGIMHVTRDVMISVNGLTLPAIAAVYGKWGIVAIVISMIAGFAAGYVLFKDEMMEN